ncbi:MGMT family protein [Arthrobacter sp. TmT3-37]
MQPRVHGVAPARSDAVVPGPVHRRHGSPAVYAEAVLRIAELIPQGMVLTYGDVAELLEAGGPRQVGRALSRSTRAVPWWRVLRAGGLPPRGLELEARARYDAEGTPLSVPSVPSVPSDPGDYRVDLGRARWSPSGGELALVAAVGASLSHAGP